MSSTPPRPAPQGSGIWYTLWTASKLTIVVIIGAIIAISMITSTESTITPAASDNATSSPSLIPLSTPALTVRGTPQPVAHVPADTWVPGHLLYVKGHTIYWVKHTFAPVGLAVGAEPALSPDGSRLAYTVEYKNWQDLWVTNLRTHASYKLVDDALTNPYDASTGKTAVMPAWSDDGASLFFAWSYPGAPIPNNAGNYDRTDLSITRCAATGPCNVGAYTTISTPYFQSGGDFDPTPRPHDSNALVYTKWQYHQARDGTSRSLPRLEVHDFASGNDVSLTPCLDAISEPTWSPDGKYIAFVKTSDDQQHTAIYVMAYHAGDGTPDNDNTAVCNQPSAAYSKASLLIQGAPFAAHPVFSPDGRNLAFVQTASDGRFHLYIARVHLVGGQTTISQIQEINRAGIVDSDHLAWAH